LKSNAWLVYGTSSCTGVFNRGDTSQKYLKKLFAEYTAAKQRQNVLDYRCVRSYIRALDPAECIGYFRYSITCQSPNPFSPTSRMKAVDS
jgi:hypothetical protein